MLEPVWWGARSGAHRGLEVDLQIRAFSGARLPPMEPARDEARGSRVMQGARDEVQSELTSS